MLAGVDAMSEGYKKVASHRPRPGGSVSYDLLSDQHFLDTLKGAFDSTY